jgi:microcompartment protein CcmK/EutM
VQTQQKELAAEALVDAKVGDRVLVTKGSDCRLAEGFVDAAVVAVVESANLG